MGSTITNDARRTCEIKSSIIMAKVAFSSKKILFTGKSDINLRKKIVKCCIWSISSNGAETLALRKADQKYLKSVEMCYWRRTENISWTGRVRTEVLHRVRDED